MHIVRPKQFTASMHAATTTTLLSQSTLGTA
jgi:hypothetical protein